MESEVIEISRICDCIKQNMRWHMRFKFGPKTWKNYLHMHFYVTLSFVMYDKCLTNIEWQMVDSLAKLISGPNSCNLFQNEGSAMLALIVGVKISIIRL